jgi:hypothetical protein
VTVAKAVSDPGDKKGGDQNPRSDVPEGHGPRMASLTTSFKVSHG